MYTDHCYSKNTLLRHLTAIGAPLKLDREPAGWHDLEQFEKIVKLHKDEVCAVILEPLVQGAAGMIVQPDDFLRSVWKIAKETIFYL
jgi:adenosylmethionine-8-amino-7-oxononanoate aminotransferase